MIEVHSLRKRYSGRDVLQDVTFSCSPGTITGFIGANGAGKSTTMRIMGALSRADSGSVTYDGCP